jgi:hypothetical protein
MLVPLLLHYCLQLTLKLGLNLDCLLRLQLVAEDPLLTVLCIHVHTTAFAMCVTVNRWRTSHSVQTA